MGNFVGQGWTNGSYTFSEVQAFNGSGARGSAFNGPFRSPTSNVDLCAYYHDLCLNVCARIKDPKKRQCCRADCDGMLASCLFYSTTSLWMIPGIIVFGGFRPNNNPGEHHPELGPDPTKFPCKCK